MRFLQLGGRQTKVSDTSQRRTFRGYKLITQYISGLEKALLDMDVQESNTYFREVSYDHLCTCIRHIHVQFI